MPNPVNISASRGAAVLGVSSWKTSVQAWLEIMEGRQPGFCAKNGYLVPEEPDNASMRWGLAFESAIVELAEGLSPGVIIDRENFYEKDFITCHIDGRYVRPTCGPEQILHEGKTTSIFYFNSNFGDPGTDKVPIEYQIQCQHQMICTGAEKVLLSVLVFPRRVEEWEEMGWEVFLYKDKYYYIRNGKEKIPALHWAISLSQMGYFHQYEITANKDLQDVMIKYYTEFWNENILKEIPPKVQDYEDIKALCPEPVGTIIADEFITSLAGEYKDINREIGATGDLAKRKNMIRVKILDFMRGADHTVDDESGKKWVLRDQTGKKLFQYDGKSFR